MNVKKGCLKTLEKDLRQIIKDIRLVTNLEVPDYKVAQFLSDAGGAAGLFLGISVATVIGCFDCTICAIFQVKINQSSLGILFNKIILK